jgi:DNA ligase-1
MRRRIISLIAPRLAHQHFQATNLFFKSSLKIYFPCTLFLILPLLTFPFHINSYSGSTRHFAKMKKFLVKSGDTKEKEVKSSVKKASAVNSVPTVTPPDEKAVSVNPNNSVIASVVTPFVKEGFQFNNELFKSSDEISSSIRNIITSSADQPLPYSALVDTFEAVASVSGRLEKENHLCKLFAAVMVYCPHELEAIVYLASNHVFPAYAGLELGIGDSLLVKAISQSTGRTPADVNTDYTKEGDLGLVAVQSRGAQKTLGFGKAPKPLGAGEVLEKFRTIAQTKGTQSQQRKIEIIHSMLTRCNIKGQEAKYIVRALQGKLRIGTAEQTILVALAHAVAEVQKLEMSQFANYSEDEVVKMKLKEEEYNRQTEHHKQLMKLSPIEENKEAKEEVMEEVVTQSLPDLLETIHDKETNEARHLRRHFEGNHTVTKDRLKEYCEIAVKRAFSECPNLSFLTSALLNHPIHMLYERCKLQIGMPVAPMLAKPSKEIMEVLKRLSGLAFTMEYKYDGERAQVHLLEDGTVKIFSRNSEDNTEKYPDLRGHIS